MGDQNWSRYGKEIRDLVQDAVQNRDFGQLNENVSDKVRQAADSVNKNMTEAFCEARKKAREKEKQKPVDVQAREVRPEKMQKAEKEPKKPQLFAKIRGLKSKAAVKTIFGGIGMVLFGLNFVSMLLGGMFVGGAATPMEFAVSLFGLAGSGLLFWRGSESGGFLRRYEQYVRMIGERTYYDLRELAAKTGKSLKFVQKDIQKMLEKRLFLEGSIDDTQTCLIVTKEAGAQYLEACRQRQEREREQREQEKRKEERERQEGALSDEVKKLLDDGHRFLEEIRQANVRIPGAEISEKISRMELVVQKIFDRVREHPEAADELHRMMNYYLPTTVKLLDAYGDMDEQPIQGEHITASKKEIEATIDTLNTAFEKLLDEIFKDTAWDVSTDISVLQTMLAQEGLTGEDFPKSGDK